MSNCELCEKEFEHRKNMRYCSEKCATRHYYIKNKSKIKARMAEYYRKEKYKEKKRPYNRKYNSRMKDNSYFKLKKRVRQLTRMKYGKALVCSECGSTNNVQYHHPRPYRKSVFVNLCIDCHEEAEKNERVL